MPVLFAPVLLVLKVVYDIQKASIIFVEQLHEREALEAGTNESACGKQSQGY